MRPQTPLISVIIPAYNEQNYIGSCLDSLIRQINCSSYEIIVADNGSNDSTIKIVKKYSEVILVKAPVRGVVSARQAALEKARGKIIVSTDADCLFKDNWLSNIEKEFNNNKIGAVAGHYYFVNAPLWAKIFPTLGAILVWLIYFLTGKTIYASAANLSFRREYFNKYSTTLTQGADERGVIKQILPQAKVKVTLKNPVYTSARRVRNGFFHGTFVTIGYYYSYNVWQTKKLGYSPIGHQPVIRSEDGQSILELIERFVFILLSIFILVLIFK